MARHYEGAIGWKGPSEGLRHEKDLKCIRRGEGCKRVAEEPENPGVRTGIHHCLFRISTLYLFRFLFLKLLDF